ncbi:hypothetical protein BsWGS_02950 [Bradybaena similaris]
MPKSRTITIIICVCGAFLLLQFIGLKFIFDKVNPKQFLEELPPWDAVKLFLSKCEASGLAVFVIEPSLLRAVRESSLRRVELWNQEHHDSVAFGVIEPGLDKLHLVLSAMKQHSYDFWEKNDPDPRGMTAFSRKSYRVISTHCLLWVPLEGHTPMLIHLVVFYKRGSYLWHAAGQDNLHVPPYSLAESYFAKTPGSYSLFEMSMVYIDGVQLQFPNDTYTFLKEMETSEFIECNYTRAYNFYSVYHLDKSKQVEVFKRKSRQLLLTVKNILDSMGVRFWLSSGTCLGWFRQCDFISHTTDVDIGIFIREYREELVGFLENSGLVLTHRFGRVNDSFELSFLYGDVKLDIFFFYVTEDHIWNGGTQASSGKKYKYIFPKFELCWAEFLELLIRVPCPPEPYISANYGPKWMIPKLAWDWKSSPSNVIENGRWPEKEWDEVIQLYA